jgi:hypothetical protein
MNYLDTAFRQLELSIKLMHAAEIGSLKREEVDLPLTIDEGKSILVLNNQTIKTDDDFINALQNNVTITFGAAAITLNRCREEVGIRLPNPINTEIDQWVCLIYQIRNAFAHDIAEPKWDFKERYTRAYKIGNLHVDLSALNKSHFDYHQIGGAETLFLLRDYGVHNGIL